MVWWRLWPLSSTPSTRILSSYHYRSAIIMRELRFCSSPLMNAVKMWCDDVYESQLCRLASHYSYQLDALFALLPKTWRLKVRLFIIGRDNPTDYVDISSADVFNEALLLPRPRLRSTAMWAFPSNDAQRLASGRPLAGNCFFSSLLLHGNSYLSLAVVFCFDMMGASAMIVLLR